MFFYVLRFDFISRTRIPGAAINGLVGSETSWPMDWMVISSYSSVYPSYNGRCCRVRVRFVVCDYFMDHEECGCLEQGKCGQALSNRWRNGDPMIGIVRAPLGRNCEFRLLGF